jgi:hypothetical protein
MRPVILSRACVMAKATRSSDCLRFWHNNYRGDSLLVDIRERMPTCSQMFAGRGVSVGLFSVHYCHMRVAVCRILSARVYRFCFICMSNYLETDNCDGAELVLPLASRPSPSSREETWATSD